jgi:hypothetical protein
LLIWPAKIGLSRFWLICRKTSSHHATSWEPERMVWKQESLCQLV